MRRRRDTLRIALTSTPEDAHELVATSMRCPHARFTVKVCQTSRTLHEFWNILEQCGPILARRRLRSLQDGLHSRTRHAPQASKESAAWPRTKKYHLIKCIRMITKGSSRGATLSFTLRSKGEGGQPRYLILQEIASHFSTPPPPPPPPPSTPPTHPKSRLKIL